jgi:hypothetical protein
MDWDQIVERSRKRILAALAPLLAVLEFDPRRAAFMPVTAHSAAPRRICRAPPHRHGRAGWS